MEKIVINLDKEHLLDREDFKLLKRMLEASIEAIEMGQSRAKMIKMASGLLRQFKEEDLDEENREKHKELLNKLDEVEERVMELDEELHRVDLIIAKLELLKGEFYEEEDEG